MSSLYTYYLYGQQTENDLYYFLEEQPNNESALKRANELQVTYNDVIVKEKIIKYNPTPGKTLGDEGIIIIQG